jgi:hypothetical protein
LAVPAFDEERTGRAALRDEPRGPRAAATLDLVIALRRASARRRDSAYRFPKNIAAPTAARSSRSTSS